MKAEGVEAEGGRRGLSLGGGAYVVLIEHDHEVWCGDAHTDVAEAERQLAVVKAEWSERYGVDGFEDGDDPWRVEVLDGPSAILTPVKVVTP